MFAARIKRTISGTLGIMNMLGRALSFENVGVSFKAVEEKFCETVVEDVLL